MISALRLPSALPRRGDWDGFLTLTTDNLAKIVILPAILLGAFHLSPEIVYGRILAGLGLTLFVGQIGFVLIARRLAAREGRSDVTALPYGISTPAMFVFLFAILGPVYAATKDALTAYRVGLAAAFVGGLVELTGAFLGPLVARVTPRAGILGTMAGVALVWIAMVPAAIIFANPLVGLPCLFIVLLGLAGNHRFPFKLPVGLIVVVLGAALGLFTGESTLQLSDIAFHPPIPVFGDLFAGLRLLFARPEILAVVIPIEIYNLIEALGNIETARAGGDDYRISTTMLWNGFGTCLAAVFGSPFPTTVYIGHPAYKRMGARTTYATMTAGFLLVASLAGVFALLQHLVPAAAISTLLVFVGLVMTQYAFQSIPAAQGIAIAAAFVPHIADLLKKQLDGTMLEILPPAAITPELAARLAANQGVYLQSYALLAHGAILVGLLWGGIVAFLVEGRLFRAAAFTAIACVLSVVGLIHGGDTIGISMSPIAWGYLIVTGLLVALALPAEVRSRLAARHPAELPAVPAEDTLAT